MPRPRPMTRRELIQGCAAGGAALALPRRARASAVSAADRKFVFIFAAGGWDATMTMEDVLDNPGVIAPPGVERGAVGDLTFMDSEERPSVRAYYEQYASRTAIISGVRYPTVSHEIGTCLGFTGKRTGIDSDWSCILSGALADRFAVPTLVLSGPCYPGALGSVVLRCGPEGQLSALLSGELASSSDILVDPIEAGAQSAIDAWLASRVQARVKGARTERDEQMARAFEAARAHATQFRSVGASLDLSSLSSLEGAAPIIASVLSMGLSRCVMIGGPPSLTRDWDSHIDNFALQTALWEDLFAGLVALNQAFDETPGVVGETLADETVIVVLSEFGRPPYLNTWAGKDHWPFTSTLVSGSGVAGGRVYGGYDDTYGGRAVDLRTGEVADSGASILTSSVGAALLMLGDVDPGEWVDDSDPLEAILA